MEELKINIDGIEHIAQMPKAAVWRKFMKFDDEKKNMKLRDYIDKHAEMIALVFDDEVTADKVLDNFDLNKIIPFYNDVFVWVITLITGKLDKIPNAETPETDND